MALYSLDLEHELSHAASEEDPLELHTGREIRKVRRRETQRFTLIAIDAFDAFASRDGRVGPADVRQTLFPWAPSLLRLSGNATTVALALSHVGQRARNKGPRMA